ncbi:hypothetical protein [uncultured Methanobrevibacter sp.]|uniref:hypothetical protein n=1 Tax=uncultured Methanobrevibacter sp. TaxID=253161 RepID=UPI002636098B|nr:hypothetical protein [uncultured Methanobrevibacter sp.]
MTYKWRSTSIKIILALFFISLLLFAFSFVNHANYTGESIAKEYNLPIGQSMFEGDSILGENESVQVPLLGNVPFIAHQISSLDLSGILLTLTTGVVPFDFTTVSSEGIDSYGKAHGFEGPGYLTYEGNQLAVKAPHTYVWGYSAPYKVLTKTSDGMDVVENGTVIQSIPTSEIKNTDFKSKYYNTTSIQNWYNYDSDSSNFTLERGIVGFSDGRSNISADDVATIFGENVSDYVAAYPDGTPIVLYMGNVTEEDGEVYSTSLGSHPEYGDSVREYNARSFVDAWNNTVIPPNSSGNGKAYIDFGSASDSNAPGGSASHGVCPPARALRSAVLSDGFDLPVGMCGDENAVLFGYNPAEDIKVTNPHDYPVKLVMWTEGSGPSMLIFAKVEHFIPS